MVFRGLVAVVSCLYRCCGHGGTPLVNESRYWGAGIPLPHIRGYGDAYYLLPHIISYRESCSRFVNNKI